MDERTPVKKRLALYPDVQEEVCDHKHFSWSGSTPNTGLLKCSMCGYTSEEIEDIERGAVLEEKMLTYTVSRRSQLGF